MRPALVVLVPLAASLNLTDTNTTTTTSSNDQAVNECVEYGGVCTDDGQVCGDPDYGVTGDWRCYCAERSMGYQVAAAVPSCSINECDKCFEEWIVEHNMTVNPESKCSLYYSWSDMTFDGCLSACEAKQEALTQDSMLNTIAWQGAGTALSTELALCNCYVNPIGSVEPFQHPSCLRALPHVGRTLVFRYRSKCVSRSDVAPLNACNETLSEQICVDDDEDTAHDWKCRCLADGRETLLASVDSCPPFDECLSASSSSPSPTLCVSAGQTCFDADLFQLDNWMCVCPMGRGLGTQALGLVPSCATNECEECVVGFPSASMSRGRVIADPDVVIPGILEARCLQLCHLMPACWIAMYVEDWFECRLFNSSINTISAHIPHGYPKSKYLKKNAITTSNTFNCGKDVCAFAPAQQCTDEDPAVFGDWQCSTVCQDNVTRTSPAARVNTDQSGQCIVDECSVLSYPCGAGGYQHCTDTDQTVAGVYNCSCMDGTGEDGIGRPAVCVFDECDNANNDCSTSDGFLCVEPNVTQRDDWSCDCLPPATPMGTPITANETHLLTFLTLSDLCPYDECNSTMTAFCGSDNQTCNDPTKNVVSMRDWYCMCTGCLPKALSLATRPTDECESSVADAICSSAAPSLGPQQCTESSLFIDEDWWCRCELPYTTSIPIMPTLPNRCIRDECNDTTACPIGTTCADPDLFWNATMDYTCDLLTAAPPTVAPPTLAPPTVAPPTLAPPTVAPPTLAPPTVAPPTLAPPTVAPPTSAPPTPHPQTHAPETPHPPTPAPPTSAPQTPNPPSPAPPSPAPPTSSPPTLVPPSAAPSTPAPSTLAPATSAPPTPAPPSPAPPTARPPSPAPPSPAPPTARPPSPAPPSPAPQTAVPRSPSPPTPKPHTAAPSTTVPSSPAPATMAPLVSPKPAPESPASTAFASAHTLTPQPQLPRPAPTAPQAAGCPTLTSDAGAYASNAINGAGATLRFEAEARNFVFAMRGQAVGPAVDSWPWVPADALPHGFATRRAAGMEVRARMSDDGKALTVSFVDSKYYVRYPQDDPVALSLKSELFEDASGACVYNVTLPGEVPRLPNEGSLRAALGSGHTSMGLLSTVANSGAAGPNAGRLALALMMSKCPRDQSADLLDASLNPMALAGGSAYQSYNGAMIGSLLMTAVLVICSAVAAVLLWYPVRRQGTPPDVRCDAETAATTAAIDRNFVLMRARFGWHVLPLGFILPGAVLGSAAASMYSHNTYRILGCVVLAVYAVLFPYWCYTIAVRATEECEERPIPGRRAWWKRLFWGDVEWVPLSRADRRGSVAWHGLHHLVFDCFKKRYHRFVCAQFGALISIALLSAWTPDVPAACDSRNWGIVGISWGYWLLLLLFRPYIAWFDNAAEILANLLNALLVTFIELSMQGAANPRDHWASSAAGAVGMCLVAVIYVSFIASVVIFVLDEYTEWRDSTAPSGGRIRWLRFASFLCCLRGATRTRHCYQQWPLVACELESLQDIDAADESGAVQLVSTPAGDFDASVSALSMSRGRARAESSAASRSVRQMSMTPADSPLLPPRRAAKGRVGDERSRGTPASPPLRIDGAELDELELLASMNASQRPRRSPGRRRHRRGEPSSRSLISSTPLETPLDATTSVRSDAPLPSVRSSSRARRGRSGVPSSRAVLTLDSSVNQVHLKI